MTRVTIRANVEQFQRSMREAAFAMHTFTEAERARRRARLRRAAAWFVLVGSVAIAAALIVGGVIAAHL